MPHSEKRFVGYNRDDKSLDADTLRKFIYGGAVADYMNETEVRCCCAPGQFSVAASCHQDGARSVLHCTSSLVLLVASRQSADMV